MADRGLDSAIITELAKRNLRIGHLLSIDFSSPDYFNDTPRNIDFGGHTYTGSGDWIKMPGIKETVNPVLDSLSISISGANAANVATALAEDYTNIEVVVYRVLLDSGFQIVDSPFEAFFGVMDNFVINEDPETGKSDIIWTVTSHWADFDRIAGRRTNDSDQKKHYPADSGLEFASRDLTGIKWGYT